MLFGCFSLCARELSFYQVSIHRGGLHERYDWDDAPRGLAEERKGRVSASRTESREVLFRGGHGLQHLHDVWSTHSISQWRNNQSRLTFTSAHLQFAPPSPYTVGSTTYG